MNSLKGHLLVATPNLQDPNFHQTVLLMLDHGEEGAAAVVLNRPSSTTLAKIAEQFFEESVDWDKPIHVGGPVPGTLIALHNQPSLSDKQVLDGVYSTIDPDKLRQFVEEQPEPSLLIFNYAGWGPGQLESELAEDSWYYLPASADQVFASTGPDSWTMVVGQIRFDRMRKTLGIDAAPADPTQN